jgi:trans-2,3-dihydro-3-hydroxyanthranilate isomerase
VFGADDLSDDAMQAIAQENNLSDPLAGHPTIATVHALVETGRLALHDDVTTIALELEVGPIRVDVVGRDGAAERIVMSQQKPKFLKTYDVAETLAAFSLAPGDALSGSVFQTVSTGTPQLMIPLAGHEALRRARLDVARYEPVQEGADFFSAHLFCLEGATAAGRTFARHFGVPPDTFEDPFTGSATGGMAAYLWHHGLIDDPVFVAEQGHWMNRPGQAFVEVVGPRDDIETVKVGGTAATILRGELEV